MDDNSQAIVLVKNIRTESVVNAFFVQAYRLARGDDENQKTIDAERVQGCAVNVILKHKLNPQVENDLARAAMIVGNCLSLGLEEAANSDPEKAVVILRKHQIEKLFQLGRSLNEEWHGKARRALDRSIFKTDFGYFAIIDYALEKRLIETSDDRFYFGERQHYQDALALLQTVETHLEIATSFPLHHIFNWNHGVFRHYQGIYGRKHKGDPGPRSGLLSLMLRSYLVKAITSGKPHSMPYKLPVYDADFRLTHNFVVQTSKLRALVDDVLLEPQKAAKAMIASIPALHRYLNFTSLHEEPMKFFFAGAGLGIHEQPAISKNAIDASMDYAEELLREFVASVLEYFKSTDESVVSDTSVAKFWANWIICHEIERGGTLQEEKAKQNPEATLTASPERLADFLTQADSWTKEFSDHMATAYDWARYYRAPIPHHTVYRTIARLLPILGWRIIPPSKGTQCGSAHFWIRVWNSTEDKRAHDEILRFFEQTDMRPSLETLAEASEEVSGMGKDERLVRLLVGKILASQKIQDGKIHGFSADVWRKLLLCFSRDDAGYDTPILPFIVQLVPDITLETALSKIVPGDKKLILLALANGTDDAKK